MALNQIDELMEDSKHPVQGGDPMLSSHSSHLMSSAPQSPRSDASVIYGSEEIGENNPSRQLHHHHKQQHHHLRQQLRLPHHANRESGQSSFSILSDCDGARHDPLLCSSQRSHASSVVDDVHQHSVDLSGPLINDSISSLGDESHTEPMYVSADALDIDHL